MRWCNNFSMRLDFFFFFFVWFFFCCNVCVYTPCCLVNKLKSLSLAANCCHFFFFFSLCSYIFSQPTSVYLWWVVCNYNTRVEYGSFFFFVFSLMFIVSSTLYNTERRWMSTSNLSWFVLHFIRMCTLALDNNYLCWFLLTYVIHLWSCP